MDLKKISKLISYWLRHCPDEAGLTVDDYGWVSLKGILKSLNDRGYELSLNQLLELNISGDKIRWVIDVENGQIKASHGHSIPVKQALEPRLPDTEIYHGTSVDNLWSILENGINSQQRQYVHLSDSYEMAKAIGSRHGKPILFEIEIATLIKDGWGFYKTEQNVWLTKDIPATYISLPPFDFNLSSERIEHFVSQLHLEVKEGHKLFDELNDLVFFVDYGPREEVYFKNKRSNKIHCVHFTYGATDNNFPSTTTYNNKQHWVESCLLFEQDNWFCFKLD